jgi:hypothetical protein
MSTAEQKILIPEVIKRNPVDEEKQPNFLDVIERLSSNPNVDVEKIQRIMNMQEQIIARRAQQDFNAAMVRAQKNMPVVAKKEKNEQTHSKYAGYDEILKQCKPIYTAEGFSVTFYQGHGTAENPLEAGNNRIMADVMHDGGHTKTVYVDIPVETTGLKGNSNMTKTHATGSSIQYGRGYLMRMIFNIPTGDDDDGNQAGGAKFISDKQKSQIVDMFNSIDLTEGQKANFFKILAVEKDDFDKIKESDFAKAMSTLKATAQAKGKK